MPMWACSVGSLEFGHCRRPSYSSFLVACGVGLPQVTRAVHQSEASALWFGGPAGIVGIYVCMSVCQAAGALHTMCCIDEISGLLHGPWEWTTAAAWVRADPPAGVWHWSGCRCIGGGAAERPLGVPPSLQCDGFHRPSQDYRDTWTRTESHSLKAKWQTKPTPPRSAPFHPATPPCSTFKIKVCCKINDWTHVRALSLWGTLP